MEIIEIKQAIIGGKKVFFPFNYWLNIRNGVIDKEVSIEIKNFTFQIEVRGNYKQIGSFNDLTNTLKGLGISIIDLNILRLKTIDTTKWGEKVIYKEGAKSIYINYYHIKNNQSEYIILFNTEGTRAIENLYIHGIWEILL